MCCFGHVEGISPERLVKLSYGEEIDGARLREAEEDGCGLDIII